MKQTEPDRTIAAFRIPDSLYKWLEAEQARLRVEKGIRIPITSVLRAMLLRMKRIDDAKETSVTPTKKAAGASK